MRNDQIRRSPSDALVRAGWRLAQLAVRSVMRPADGRGVAAPASTEGKTSKAEDRSS